jgi:methionyl-tRNA formyltransferase
MRIAFLGTPDFAVPCLKKSIALEDVVLVVTQPDRRRGRGKKRQPTPVKKEALKHNIEVFQPENINSADAIQKLKQLSLDLIVVVAYGQILTKDILNIPRYGCINVHASLLPKLRGAAPINWAIVRGHDQTGVTTMVMDEGLDTGDMIDKRTIEITNAMTAGQLHDRLMMLGAEVLEQTINKLKNDHITRTKQVDDNASYAPMIDKKMSEIDWEQSAQDIHNRVRGFNPWPGTFSFYKGQKFKIFQTQVIEEQYNATPGQIIKVSDDGMLVACQQNALLIKKIQFPNKRKMMVNQYILGNDLEENIILGRR